jgi:hypothetical protein
MDEGFDKLSHHSLVQTSPQESFISLFDIQYSAVRYSKKITKVASPFGAANLSKGRQP